jgi:hypothetical protein
MSVTFREVRRENVPLLLGVAGGTGSGKTFSALRLARGLSAGKPFALIDTENGRAKHYADLFPEMRHADLRAPFRPDKYADAIQVADGERYPVVVVDSASHEWAGDGGCLDWHDDLMGGDQKKNLSAWIEPKRSHKAMVTRLLQVRAHVILCFRAEPKVEAVRRPNGSTEIVPKASLTGLDGWLPISERMLPYELTASFLLMADAPGVPKPIKLPEQLRDLFPLDKPLSEDAGVALAGWTAGGSPSPAASPPAASSSAAEPDVMAFLEVAASVGDEAYSRAVGAVAKQREARGGRVDAGWLERQSAKLAELAPKPADAELSAGEESLFAGMVPEKARQTQ